MRVLVSNGPSYGLYYPVVPMAWALRAAGHDVLVVSPENMAQVVASSGLGFAATHPGLVMRDVMTVDREGRSVALAADEAGMLRQVGEGFGRLAAATLPGVVDVMDWWRPDLVLAEPHAYAAAVAAAARGVSCVRHGIGMGYDESIDVWGASEIRDELDAMGLADLPAPDLVLDPCPPPVRTPHTDARSSVRFVPFEAPSRVERWMVTRSRPRILLTLGTVAPQRRGRELFRALLASLGELGVELVVAVDDAVVDELGPLPDAVVRAGWLPLATVMNFVDLAVHHCGGGTTMAGIAAGVPQLLIPQLIPEQHDSARRLAAFGAARRLEEDEVAPERIRAECEALLAHPGFTRQAGLLRADNLSRPAPHERVADLERLVVGQVRAA